MAQKIQQLTGEQIDKLRSFQELLNESVFNIGRMTIREKSLTEELRKIKNSIEELKNQYEGINNDFTNYLAEMDAIYPNGEVDLKEGTVTYEFAE